MRNELDSTSERVVALIGAHRLSPTQRRIAQYLMRYLNDAIFLSSKELARHAGVSQPSVIRFAVALGFRGYPQLQKSLREIARSARDEPATQVQRTTVHAIIEADRQHLARLEDLLTDPVELRRLGGELARSTPLPVLGMRLSAAVATYFAYGAQRIHPDVRLISAGGSTALDALAQCRDAGAGWLVAFAMPRYPAELVEAMRFARTLGIRVAAVSDDPLSPVAADADVLLPAGVGTQGVFDSHAPAMTMAAVLLQVVADGDAERTQHRLERAEQLSETHRYYLDA